MLPLTVGLRKQLENAIPNARDLAEEAAGVVLTTLAVDRSEPYPSMSPDQRRLRNGLRARARQLGNGVMTDGLVPLQEEIAYQQWHRMVFACFLAENNLLMHSSGVPVTLKDCNDLAADEDELNGWIVAAKYASAMLPGIFRLDDPAAQVRLAPEGQRALESILKSFPPVTFAADDSLGWMYQFWQSKKKEEINRSERKIGGADLAPVTQLFTEDYMVRFLLENSLGAWWAGKHPESKLLKQWDYLRFKEDGTPAAGTFPGWPQSAAEVTVMDPCCGSGHFLVAAFDMLCHMRMEEEGLDETATAEAVLRDNLFGLEIDPRCTQIAVFALVLTAWKHGGYRPLPVPNVACSGIPVQGQLETWLKLAGDDIRLRTALEQLYTLFTNAPDMGSLINPADLPQNEMFTASYEEVAPVLEQALAKERFSDDPVAEIFGAAAEGVSKAARYLAKKFTLVATNVPYLMHGRQSATLKDYTSAHHPKAKSDLATSFLERSLDYLTSSGTVAIVSPQNWLFQLTYRKFRENLLVHKSWNAVILVGENGFKSPQAAGAFISLVIISNIFPSQSQFFFGIDISQPKSPEEKARLLLSLPVQIVSQAAQLHIPDARIVLESYEQGNLLSIFADSLQGISPADFAHYGRCFWELSQINGDWRFWQSTVDTTILYGGREHVLWLNKDFYDARSAGKAFIRGEKAWKKKGVVVSLMRNLPVTLYTGEPTDTNMAIVLPKRPEDLPAIWTFCSSPDFCKTVRKIDRALKVTNGSLVKIPFELERWQKVAEAAGSLPEPHSEIPRKPGDFSFILTFSSLFLRIWEQFGCSFIRCSLPSCPSHRQLRPVWRASGVRRHLA